MPDSIVIIKANHGDLHYVTPLFDAYRQFYGQPSDRRGCERFLSDIMSRDESVIFVALAGGNAAGFTQLYPSYSSVSLKRLWILNDLYVAEENRQSGVAAALLNRARVFAVETGAKGLTLETAADNVPAQRLYEKLGWTKDNDFFHYNLDV